MHDTPEIFILIKDEDWNWSKQEWHYHSVIGHRYITLSQCIRDLISLRHVMLEVSTVFGMKFD